MNFKEWYDQFWVKDSFRPNNLDDFIKRNEESHKKLNEKLGGTYKTFTVKVPATFKHNILHDFQKQISSVKELMPGYIGKYKLTDKELCEPKLAKHRGMSTAKHLLGYADRSKLEDMKRVKLIRVIAELGQIWAKKEKTTETINVTICTDPRGFLILGSLSIDIGSCFSQFGTGNGSGYRARIGGINSDKKYAFATGESTFMVFIHKGEFNLDELGKNYKPMYRIIGGFLDDFKEMHTVNAKPYDTNIHEVPSILESVYKEFSGQGKCVVSPNMFGWQGGCNYTDNPIVSYSTSMIKNIQKLQLPTLYSKEYKPGHDAYANR